MNKISCHSANRAQAQSYATEISVQAYRNGQIVAEWPESAAGEMNTKDRAITRRDLRNFAGKRQLGSLADNGTTEQRTQSRATAGKQRSK